MDDSKATKVRPVKQTELPGGPNLTVVGYEPIDPEHGPILAHLQVGTVPHPNSQWQVIPSGDPVILERVRAVAKLHGWIIKVVED